MPQNNPPIANGKSETFNFGVAGSNFTTFDGGLSWIAEFPITIPPEFTSIEWVWHIRTVLGGGSARLNFYTNFTPDTMTDISQSPITWPSDVGGGGAGDYPLFAKGGMGPAFFNSQPISPSATGLNGLSQPFVYNFVINNANNYQDTTISTPFIFVYTAFSPTGGPDPFEIDATVYYTFYK